MKKNRGRKSRDTVPLSLFIKGQGVVDSWKKMGVKISWHCPFASQLKGVWHEIFDLYFFSFIKYIGAPDKHPKTVLQNFSNSRRYSLTKFNFSHSPVCRTPGSEIFLIKNSIFKTFKHFIHNPRFTCERIFHIVPFKGTRGIQNLHLSLRGVQNTPRCPAHRGVHSPLCRTPGSVYKG